MTDLPMREPIFYKDHGKIMFTFKIDEGNVIGPREATERDQANYPEVYQAAVDGAKEPKDNSKSAGEPAVE